MTEREIFLNNQVVMWPGDARKCLAFVNANSIDSVVSDPPYFLTSIVKRFGAEGAAPAQFGTDGRFSRLSGGFMNAKWDAPEAPTIDPGFAHWFAGFADGEGCFHVHKKTVNDCETFDCQFSINLRADDKPILLDIQRQLGIGTVADRPARESGKAQARYCVSSKADCQKLRAIFSIFPLRAKKARDFEIWSMALDAWIKHEPRGGWDDVSYYRDQLMAVRNFGSVHRPERLFFYTIGRELLRVLKPGGHVVIFNGTRTYHHMVCGLEDAGFEIRDSIAWLFGQGFPKSKNIGDGWGTALKPAMELVCLARKPLSEKTVAENVLAHGTGAINVDGCRVETNDSYSYPNGRGGSPIHNGGQDCRAPAHSNVLGRWPANVIHDGSKEVVGAFPERDGAVGMVQHSSANSIAGTFKSTEQSTGGAGIKDNGSAARFFYTAKADADDRLGFTHPTIKPVDLMQWLVRLVTPKGGMVLDPFAGTGTTAEAAFREGMRCMMLEKEPEYQAMIRERMRLVMSGPDERSRETAKRKPEPPKEGLLALMEGQ